MNQQWTDAKSQTSDARYEPTPRPRNQALVKHQSNHDDTRIKWSGRLNCSAAVRAGVTKHHQNTAKTPMHSAWLNNTFASHLITPPSPAPKHTPYQNSSRPPHALPHARIAPALAQHTHHDNPRPMLPRQTHECPRQPHRWPTSHRTRQQRTASRLDCWRPPVALPTHTLAQRLTQLVEPVAEYTHSRQRSLAALGPDC